MKYILVTTFIILFCLSFFSVFVTSSYAKAEALNIKTTPQKVYPDSSSYYFKRLWEKIYLRLMIFPNTKTNYEKNLLDKRFSELVYVVNNNLLDYLEQASQRFAAAAGVYTDSLINQDVDSKTKTIADFKKYSDNLQILTSVYPYDSSFWMLVTHDINTLKILSERLK